MNAQEKISVVLCTYQGERFLPELLRSLKAQTCQPHEVVVQDDASTDGTLKLLRAERSLPLSLAENPSRLGFAANFAVALARATGDLIFLCDHDDVWEKDKVEKMLAAFRNPEIGLVFSDASFLGESGQPLPGTVLGANHLPGVNGRWSTDAALSTLLRRNPVPGMCMAFRVSLRDFALPIPKGWPHDYWLLLLAAVAGKGIYCVREPLVRYRQHAGQAIGARRSPWQRWFQAGDRSLAAYHAESKAFLALAERAQAVHPAFAALAREKSVFLERRSRLSSSSWKRLCTVASEFSQGNYHRFEAGGSSALKDLLARP